MPMETVCVTVKCNFFNKKNANICKKKWKNELNLSKILKNECKA